MKSIVLSVRPPWARQLVTGEKTVELRKRSLPGTGRPVKAFIYETKTLGGCGAIIGEVIFEGRDSQWRPLPLHEVPPHALPMVMVAACVTFEQARSYSGKPGMWDWTNVLWAWCVGNNKPVEYTAPKELCGPPPQSWYWGG